MHPKTRAKLVETARDMIKHLERGDIDRAPDIMEIDTAIYSDPARFKREKEKIFRRLPIMLAATCELANAGDYKAMNVAGVPTLLVRGKDGAVRAFLNSCTHRGSILTSGVGRSSRFTCPYHGWTFGTDGQLFGVASQDQYGDIDKASMGLVAFPTYENAGLIWAILDPNSSLDIKRFLSGVDEMIAGFNLESWQPYDQGSLSGANWKLAFDAHLDFYHLPVLHRRTFGSDISNLAQYYFQGAHQRLGLMSANPAGQENLEALKELPEEDWPTASLLFGEWIIFPNVSLNCFDVAGRVMVISQVFPGKHPEESVTVQTFLVENQPEEKEAAKLKEFVAFIRQVVGEEDLPMSTQQQRVLSSGLLKKVQFGRNELGLQEYHRWLERLLAADDGSLQDMFPESF